MAKTWTLIIIACVVLHACSLVSSEIHRAKAKPKIRYPSGSDRIKDHPNPGHTQETWILSMISATLVGLSGIFPLLVIPLEAGKALRNGAPAARLKLLLSFAVGGLLGDVFLHLLPEAWKHVEKGDHRGHSAIGCWILMGVLTFLVVEKIFPDGSDEDQENEENSEKEYTQKHSQKNTAINGKVTANGTSLTNGIIVANGTSTAKKRKKTAKGKDKTENGHSLNSSDRNANSLNDIVQNGSAVVQNGSATIARHESSGKKEGHIKTSGWLNLMANVVDNFTHGLAVAGSYCISTKCGILTTIIILLHEIPHEIGDFAILLRSGFDRWKAAYCQLLTATGGLLGAVAALAAESAQEAGARTAWILPFTSGGFIYVALVTVVPDLLKEQNPRESAKQVLCLLLGLGVMASVALFLDEHDLPSIPGLSL